MKLREGDRVHFVDERKGRHYAQTLRAGRHFQFSGEFLPHEALIGTEEGRRVTLSRGTRFWVVRPTLGEYVLKMPRGAQIVYPKDLGVILIWADIYPGARVLEAGLGSGALTMALLRAVGKEGRVISYEVREDFAQRALENIRAYLGDVPNLTVRLRDLYEEGLLEEDRDLDRVILDLPEPWRAIPHVVPALRPGGILLTFLPTVLQVSQVVACLRETRAFIQIQTLEVLLRTWHVAGKSVRPDHRMVAHTGFITVARRVIPEEEPETVGAEGPPSQDGEDGHEDLPGG